VKAKGKWIEGGGDPSRDVRGLVGGWGDGDGQIIHI
jgi:hypothetical protein